MLMTSEGVKRGAGFRRMPSADRWDFSGWDQLKGIPWELNAPRLAAGEQLMDEDRLVVPPPPSEDPPQRSYIRREDVHKHGATEGCPGCQCILEDRRTTVPHTEACRARIIEAMEKDEVGAERLQTHAKKRKEAQAKEKSKPAVVSTGEQDFTVEDVAGEPPEQEAFGSAPSAEAPVYPEDPQERAKLKRQSIPLQAESSPKAKQKTAPQSVKRTGEMKMASAPPLVKAKPAPAQGVKRVAEEGTENLEERTTAQPAAAPAAAPPAEGSTEQAPPQDLHGAILTRLKEVAVDNIKTKHWWKKRTKETTLRSQKRKFQTSQAGVARWQQLTLLKCIHQRDSQHWLISTS